jgi:hypothetical protein
MDDSPTSIRRLLKNTANADDWYQLIVEASGAMASMNKFVKSVLVLAILATDLILSESRLPTRNYIQQITGAPTTSAFVGEIKKIL